MSGIPRTKYSSIKEEKLPKRTDISNPNIVAELPKRTVINLVVVVKDIDPLARVIKKFQVAGVPTLQMEVSKYIAGTKEPQLITDLESKEYKLYNQALQTFLHELMHVALWDDVTISHSPDETSLLYYYVKGNIHTYNDWDLKVMKEASNRIGNIMIDAGQLPKSAFAVFAMATFMWNLWIGREFFKLVQN